MTRLRQPEEIPFYETTISVNYRNYFNGDGYFDAINITHNKNKLPKKVIIKAIDSSGNYTILNYQDRDIEYNYGMWTSAGAYISNCDLNSFTLMISNIYPNPTKPCPVRISLYD